MKLEPKYVEKPWGRTSLPAGFAAQPGKRIGEIWFTGAPDLPLLVKYLFTSEKLSIQVHPDDEQAKRLGYERGKSECWYIVDADPDARIGLGLLKTLDSEELRNSALDGSIEELMDWRPVAPGDFISVEPGTIHAIGGGLSLVEIQQNSDVTFRLCDYGRPRELHIDEAVQVANAGPYSSGRIRQVGADEDDVLLDGPLFNVALCHADSMQDRTRWVVPLEGRVACRGDVAAVGDCLLLGPGDSLEADGARLLVAAVTEG